jgi:phosphoglucosamine mutase
MAKRLFGTDGIRGVAGEFPLDAPTLHAFGLALGDAALQHEADPEILVGMDTRESGPGIAEEVAGGLAARGIRVRFAGVITTPGVAWITRTDPFAAGVMISASHNPYRDNGIKVFGHSGFKLPDEEEGQIEREIFALLDGGVTPEPRALTADPDLNRRYIDYLASTVQASLSGIRMVVDCGNGSASGLAAGLFSDLGASVEAICCQPNGRNINERCGSLHVEALQTTVLDRSADVGVAFDGDADRAIFVSRSGAVVNGDGVLLVAARALKSEGKLTGDQVVATVMSNLGLEHALAREGIRLIRTPVGDKYVLEEMVRIGAALGGEQSGHVIFRDYATTGDGLLTALRVLETAIRRQAGLDELTRDLTIFPQLLTNVIVRQKKPLESIPAVTDEIRACEAAFGNSGRIVVRFSGTEPLARVMVEGPDQRQVDEFSARIANAIRRELE